MIFVHEMQNYFYWCHSGQFTKHKTISGPYDRLLLVALQPQNSQYPQLHLTSKRI